MDKKLAGFTVSGSMSKWKPLTNYVLQKSLLGQILFKTFISDIVGWAPLQQGCTWHQTKGCSRFTWGKGSCSNVHFPQSDSPLRAFICAGEGSFRDCRWIFGWKQEVGQTHKLGRNNFSTKLLLNHFLRFPWEHEDKTSLYKFQGDVCRLSTQVPVPLQEVNSIWPDLQDKD